MKPKMKSRIPQLFLFQVYVYTVYGMGIFTYEIDLRILPLKNVAEPKRRFEISAGSYRFQRGQ
jgi:hypothetical protein